MATYLELINRLRGFLREEAIGALASSDILTVECGRLINRSVRHVMGEYDWHFLKRHDGVATYMAPTSGTIGTVTNSSTSASLRAVTVDESVLFAQPCKVIFTGDASFPNSTFRIVSGDSGIPALSFHCVLNAAFPGTTATGTAAWTVYADEVVLPATVRRVLSVRHEETPLRLVFEQEELVHDDLDPRPFDMRQEQPSVAFVGSYAEKTYETGGTATGGMVLRIYPVPSTQLLIHYSYIYQHAEMTAATDVLTGVPEAVCDLVVARAFHNALLGNLQNDPQRAGSVRQSYEIDLARAIAASKPDPNRRDIPTPFGSSRLSAAYRRWPSGTIPSA